jgi:gliding motility-associated-like protein
VEDSLSVALGVLEQKYNVQEKLLQNDSYSGGYDIQIVRQPRLDSVRLEDNGQTLHYILKAGTRFGTDTFYYALCPPNGCPAACDSAWVVVRLQNGDLKWVEEHMPNLITPGGSKGENDVFDPLGFAQNKGSVYPELSTVRLYIYNRWGEVVHHPNPYEVWDGTQGRVDLPQATYYYLFRFEIGGTLYQLRGAVNLLR